MTTTEPDKRVTVQAKIPEILRERIDAYATDERRDRSNMTWTLLEEIIEIRDYIQDDPSAEPAPTPIVLIREALTARAKKNKPTTRDTGRLSTPLAKLAAGQA